MDTDVTGVKQLMVTALCLSQSIQYQFSGMWKGRNLHKQSHATKYNLMENEESKFL